MTGFEIISGVACWVNLPNRLGQCNRERIYAQQYNNNEYDYKCKALQQRGLLWQRLRRVKDRHTKWRDDLCIQCNALSFPLYNLAEAFDVFFEWNSGQDVKSDPQLRARRNSHSEKHSRTEAIFTTKTENTAIKSWTNGNKFCTLCVTTLCSLM